MSDSSIRSEVQAILFDFDGTLAVPALDFSELRRRAAAAVGAFTDIPMRADIPVMEELDRIRAALEPSAGRHAYAAAMRAIEDVEIEAAGRSALFPFVLPMLETLKQRGIAAGVVTRNCPAAVFKVFPDLGEHVGCVLTRDDVQNVKPHPEHIGKALALLQRKAEGAVMVGDHPMDIVAGKRAGTLTAGVLTGGSAHERLAEAEPDWLAEDAGEIMRILGLMR